MKVSHLIALLEQYDEDHDVTLAVRDRPAGEIEDNPGPWHQVLPDYVRPYGHRVLIFGKPGPVGGVGTPGRRPPHPREEA